MEGENEDQIQLRRLEILRSLIDNELMLQRAEKAGLVATDADVDARLNELKAPYTKEEFDKQLKQWGLTLDELKARIRKDESVKKLFNKDITSKINITDADVANFYNANRGQFQSAGTAGAHGADPGDAAARSERPQSEERQGEERRGSQTQDPGAGIAPASRAKTSP